MELYAVQTPIIISVPGRGYRFVAPTEVLVPPVSGSDENRRQAVKPGLLSLIRRACPRPGVRLVLGTLLTACMIASGFAIGAFDLARTDPPTAAPSSPDPRLGLLISIPTTEHHSAIEVTLSIGYLITLLKHLQLYEELTVFQEKVDARPSFPPHFNLEMVIGEHDGLAQVTLELQEWGTGRHIEAFTEQISTSAPSVEQSALIMRLVRAIRSELFVWEQSHRSRSPRDGVDIYIDAQVSRPYEEPPQLEHALSLAEQAVKAKPASARRPGCSPSCSPENALEQPK